jgi:hypothetical protein
MSDKPHSFQWPQYVIDRVMQKRGRLNVYGNFPRGPRVPSFPISTGWPRRCAGAANR